MVQNRFFWRPVVISSNPFIREPLLRLLRQRLHSPERTVLREYKTGQQVLEFARTVNANVCIVDVSSDESGALALLRELAPKGLTLVVVHTTNDSGLILRCLRSGAHEFLFAPFEGQSCWAVLDELAARHRSQNGKTSGLVYVVAPSKPNVGSTTVATNLAVRAQQEQGGPVLLAELDPLYGTVRFMLKSGSGEFAFPEAFANWGRMDDELWNGYLVQHAGIDVLLAPDGPCSIAFKAPEPDEFLAFLRARYSIVFLDTPGLITDWYVRLSSAADGVLLVTANDLTSIHTARRSIAALEAVSFDMSKLNVIINRYLPENGLSDEAIETALRKTILATLPYDHLSLQKAVLDGRTLDSKSILGESLDALCRKIMGVDAPSKRERSWSSFFSLSKGISAAADCKTKKEAAILGLGMSK